MAAGGLCPNGFWKRKHPGGGEGAESQIKTGTEGSSRLFVEGWIEEREEKRRGARRWVRRGGNKLFYR